MTPPVAGFVLFRRDFAAAGTGPHAGPVFDDQRFV